MAIESVTNIADLNASNPVDTTDPGADLGDHLRNIKGALLTDLPNITGPITATQAELNILDGVTSTAAELNLLDGATATATEINQLDESARAVSGFVSGPITHLEGDSGAVATGINIASLITTFDSVGPVGSGATHSWADMSSVPAGAKALIIKLVSSVSGSSTANVYSINVYARATGSAVGTGSQTQIQSLSFTNRSAALEQTDNTVTATIPLDGSLRFDAAYTAAGSGVIDSCVAFLVGWIE